MKFKTSLTINKFALEGATDGLDQSILASAINIANNAKSLCPVDKAQLRNSIMYRSKKKQGLFNDGGGEQAPSNQKLETVDEEQTAYVGTNSDHWYPEFGTNTQVAQPFLRPAGEIEKGDGIDSVVIKYNQEAMKKAFDKRKKERRGL